MTRRTKGALIAIGAVVTTLLALQTPLLRPVRGAAWQVFVATVGEVAGFDPFHTEQSIQAELERLQAENIRLQTEARQYRYLQEQLGSTAYDNLRSIPARVAAQPFDIFHTEIVINRGARDGVTLNAPVVTREAMLVGFITQLYDQTAIVQLVTHPDTSVAAQIVDNDQAKGLLVGRTYTSLALTTVPRDVTLETNQSVVTVTQEAIPAGLLIGTVKHIQNEENEAYQQATLSLPYDIDAITAVTVLVAP